jgi:hypothetical protein
MGRVGGWRKVYYSHVTRQARQGLMADLTVE